MQVRVWNDNVHVYQEKWRDEVIEIPPKQYITMEFMDASDFLGTRPPLIEVDASGIQKPTSYKMLRIEKLDGREISHKKEFRCMMDGKVFNSQASLDEYIERHYSEQIVDEESKVAFEKTKKAKAPKGVKKDDTSRD